MSTDKQHQANRPACVGMEEVAAIFGWPNYYLPFLVRAGHLKPLGRPAQNARKWFATVEIARMSQDPDWLDKAIRIVEIHVSGGSATPPVIDKGEPVKNLMDRIINRLKNNPIIGGIVIFCIAVGGFAVLISSLAEIKSSVANLFSIKTNNVTTNQPDTQADLVTAYVLERYHTSIFTNLDAYKLSKTFPLDCPPMTNRIRIMPNGIDGGYFDGDEPQLSFNGANLTILNLNLSNISFLRIEYEKAGIPDGYFVNPSVIYQDDPNREKLRPTDPSKPAEAYDASGSKPLYHWDPKDKKWK
jgi:hypothetical protein